MFSDLPVIKGAKIYQNKNGIWVLSFEHSCEIMVEPTDEYNPEHKYGKRYFDEDVDWFCKQICFVLPSSYKADADYYASGVRFVLIPENEAEADELDNSSLLVLHEYNDDVDPKQIATKIFVVSS